jgi:hypothetical protein
MKRITSGTINVFTFKDGLLSAVAHDLRLTLDRFELEVDADAGTVAGRFWPASLRIDGAIKNGQLDASGLSERERREIHDNLTDKILKTDRSPEVRFQGRLAVDAPVGRVDGTLTLSGRDAPVTVTLRREAGRYRGEAELAPSRWGIPPFKALMGAIKLQDRVRLTFDLPDA